MKKETHIIEGGRKLYMYSFENTPKIRQRSFWNAVGQAWRNEFDAIEEWMQPITRAMADRIGNYPRRGLDLGCGAATMRLGDKWRLFGVDPASEMLMGARVVQGDSHALPFEGASFDAVVSRMALMLDSDPVTAFSEAFRILRLGGTLTVAVWDSSESNSWVSSAEAALADRLGIRLPASCDPSAYRLANPEEVRSLLHQAGFGAVHSDSVHVPYFARMTAENTLDFLLRFIGPISTMFEKLPAESRAPAREEAITALEGVSRSGSAWVHHAVREPKTL